VNVEADWWARGIGIGAAVIAALSLGWNIIAWLSVALHDRRQVSLTFRTASGKRARRTIKYKGN
jgi:hypothetical protein